MRSGSDILSILAAWVGALLLGLWLFAFQIGLDKGHPPPGILQGIAAFFGSLILAPVGVILGGVGLRRARRQGRIGAVSLLAVLLNLGALWIVVRSFLPW